MQPKTCGGGALGPGPPCRPSSSGCWSFQFVPTNFRLGGAVQRWMPFHASLPDRLWAPIVPGTVEHLGDVPSFRFLFLRQPSSLGRLDRPSLGSVAFGFPTPPTTVPGSTRTPLIEAASACLQADRSSDPSEKPQPESLAHRGRGRRLCNLAALASQQTSISPSPMAAGALGPPPVPPSREP